MKILKKVFLLSFLVAFTVSANAQLKLGVKAGFNASTINGIGDGDEDTDYTYKPGFHVGVAAQYMFAPQMGIETGLYYSQLGVKGEYEKSGSTYSYKSEGTLNPSYLQLPLSFLYKFDLGNGLQIYPSAGLYFGYGIAGKMKYEDSWKEGNESGSDKSERNFFGKDKFKYDGESDPDEEKTELTNRFDMGLTFGVNLEISNMTIGLGYDLGLSKINKEKFEEPILDEDYNIIGTKKLDDWKNGNIKVTVGYFF